MKAKEKTKVHAQADPLGHSYILYVCLYTLVNLKLSGEKQFLNINQLNGGIVGICFADIYVWWQFVEKDSQVLIGGKSRVSNLKVMQIGL